MAVFKYEDEKEFRKAVERTLGRPVSDDEWEDAMDTTFDDLGGKWRIVGFDDADRDEVVSYLSKAAIRPKTYTTLEGAERKAQLEAEERAKVMRHAAKEIREAVFGDPSRPFETMDEADDWILAEAKKQGEGESVGLLEYGGRSEVWRRVEVHSGSPLETLWRMTLPSFQLIPYHQPDWRWHRALALILTDEVIPVGPFQYAFSQGHEYTITIRSPDVSNEFIGELCQALRMAVWRVKAPSGRTPDQVERAFYLVKFVERTTHLSWPNRITKWNQEYPQWAFLYEGEMREAFKRAVPRREYIRIKKAASQMRKLLRDLRLERQRKSP